MLTHVSLIAAVTLMVRAALLLVSGARSKLVISRVFAFRVFFLHIKVRSETNPQVLPSFDLMLKS